LTNSKLQNWLQSEAWHTSTLTSFQRLPWSAVDSVDVTVTVARLTLVAAPH